MSKPFSAFYDALLPELPGCTTAMVDYHLRAIARDFCFRTDVWHEPLPEIFPEPGNSTFPLDLSVPSTTGQLAKVLDVHEGDEWLWSVRPPRPGQTKRPKFLPSDPPFTLASATVGSGLEITFDTEPKATVIVHGSMQPAQAATSLPDVLLTQHLEAIKFGVLSRLMVMGNKKWTDRTLAAEYENRYAIECNAAACVAALGDVRAPLRTRRMAI